MKQRLKVQNMQYLHAPIPIALSAEDIAEALTKQKDLSERRGPFV